MRRSAGAGASWHRRVGLGQRREGAGAGGEGVVGPKGRVSRGRGRGLGAGPWAGGDRGLGGR